MESSESVDGLISARKSLKFVNKEGREINMPL